MFRWMTRWFKEDPANPHTWDGRYRAFLNGLADRKTPLITASWESGFEFRIALHYGDVTVDVEYNRIRGTWELETWSHEAKTQLFYYDCLDWPPHKAIKFLQDRYGLEEMVNEAVLIKEEAEKKTIEATEKVIETYTKESK